MSKDTLDITGNKYGNLTAVRYSHTGKNYMHYWIFKCDCGKEITTRKTSKNRCFELNGKIKCAAEWCEELGIKSSTFFQRLKNGLNPFTGERV